MTVVCMVEMQVMSVLLWCRLLGCIVGLIHLFLCNFFLFPALSDSTFKVAVYSYVKPPKHTTAASNYLYIDLWL